MEGKRVPTQSWAGGWILCSGCGHVGFAQLYVAGECYRLGAAGTLRVPNVPVGLDRRDRSVGLAASKQAQHLLLAPAERFVEHRTGAVTAFLRISQA